VQSHVLQLWDNDTVLVIEAVQDFKPLPLPLVFRCQASTSLNLLNLIITRHTADCSITFFLEIN
jgi:hypothetical protein